MPEPGGGAWWEDGLVAAGQQPAGFETRPEMAAGPPDGAATPSRRRGLAWWPRSRMGRLAAVTLAALLFVAISGWFARFYSTENAERDQILSLLEAETAGNAAGMLAKLGVCKQEAACRAVVALDARRERGSGSVKILALSAPTAYAIHDTSGETRVAWKQGSRLPVVQCVLVHRHGSPVTGMNVTLERIDAPIVSTADCPKP